MNTKKQYMAPASEVVDVEVQLMNNISFGDQSAPQVTWENNTPADSNDEFI